MFFIGQEHITKQLNLSLNYLYDHQNEGMNFLIRGPSGYGKTELAMRICNYLVMAKYCMYLGDLFDRRIFKEDMWVHFIDEVHLMKNPEVLYPLMGKNKYVFVLATNHDSVLEEALSNRCTNLLFTDYNDNDLVKIFKSHCRVEIPDEVIRYIIEVSGRNPRIMTQTYGKNLYMYYLNRKDELNQSVEKMIEKIDELHGIENGLNTICNRYLKVMKELGGKASLDLIASALKLDKNTLKYEVEPVLLYKKMINISNKGRELC